MDFEQRALSKCHAVILFRYERSTYAAIWLRVHGNCGCRVDALDLLTFGGAEAILTGEIGP